MGSGTQPFVAGCTSGSVKNDTKYERVWKVNVPEQSSQSMSMLLSVSAKVSSLEHETALFSHFNLFKVGSLSFF